MSSRTVLRSLLAAGVLALGPAAGCATERVSPIVLAAESTATWLDRDGLADPAGAPGPAYKFVHPPEEYHYAVNDLPVVARDLDDHLAKAPRDARALLVRGRLLAEQFRLRQWRSTGVDVPASDVDPRDEVVAVFDRVLAIDSTRTEAHFWNAFTLVTPVMISENYHFGRTVPRYEDALPHARRAYRAAPKERRRIDVLEQCLLALGEDLEAERVRDPSAGAGGSTSQVARILERGKQVPDPPGLRRAPRLRELLGLLIKKQPGDRTDAAAHARARRFEGESVSVDTLLAFYRARWPGLVWNEQQLGPDALMMNFTTRFAVATLRWTEGSGWVPTGVDIADPLAQSNVLVLTIEERDFERLRSALPPESLAPFLAALPDSLRDVRIPPTTLVTLLDRVEGDR